MAKAGNHGQIIPRDKRLLWRLYWHEQHSLPSLGRMFGVTHKSVEKVFRELNIPRRKRHTKGQSRWRKCIKCGEPVHKIKHAGNGAIYGRLCKEHRREHYNALARSYVKRRPDVQEKRKEYIKRWYAEGGPKNPQGEGQWISKSKILLRNAKKLLREPSREASPSRSAASRPGRTSPA